MATEPWKVGDRVYWGLYGHGGGVVYSVQGKSRPDNVRQLFGSAIVTGGNAWLSVVFQDGGMALQVPEAIVSGVQWRRLPGHADADEIAALLFNADKVKSANVEAQLQANRDAVAERARLASAHPTLKRGTDRKTATANMRAQLRDTFPGVKFSVTSDHNSINVRWEDGPTGAQVDAVAKQYKQGHFDGSDDSYKHDRGVAAAWCDTFGGVSYVFTHREHTDDLIGCAIVAIADKYNVPAEAEPTIEDFRQGRTWNRYPIGSDAGNGHWSWQEMIHRQMRELAA